MTKAIIYARYSPRPKAKLFKGKKDADESQSNEKQIEHIRECNATAKNYEIVGVLTDSALTGADDEKHPDPLKALAKRPGICEAIRRVKKGMVLLVRWRSRIARDPYIQQAVERMIGLQGGRVEATDESNATGLGAELERGVLATVAKWDVIKIRLMTTIAMRKHQYQSHRRMSRREFCPFGWGCAPEDDKRLIEVPEEQAAIALIKRAAKRGMGLREICRWLDAQGVQRRGKSWQGGHMIVKRILARAQSSQ